MVEGQAHSDYVEMSGTSMAAAVVSGAAALLLEANPALTPAEVKMVLQLTSSRVAGAGLIEAGCREPEYRDGRRRGADGDATSGQLRSIASEPQSASRLFYVHGDGRDSNRNSWRPSARVLDRLS